MTLKRLLLGSHASSVVWSVLELGCSTGAQLILTPLLLNRLGVDQFSIWVIALTVLVGSATLSLGTGTALLPVLAHANAKGDATGAWAAISIFFRRSVMTSAVLFVVMSAATSLGWTPAILSALEPWDLWLLASAILTWAFITEIDNGLSSALKARSRFDISALIEAVTRAAQLGLTFWLLGSGGLALIPIILAIAVTGIKAWTKLLVLRAQWPRLTCQINATEDRTTSVTAELGASGSWIWLGLLSGLMFNAFDRWFLAAQLGAAALTAYATCAQIAQMPHALVAAAGQTLAPWAARRRDQLAAGDVRHGIRRVLLLATAAAALPSLMLLLVLQPLLGWWISKDFAVANLPTAQGLTIAFCLLALNVPAYFLLFGLGRVRTSTILSAFSGIVFVGGCLIIPPAVPGFVFMKGLFAAMTLGLVVCVLVLTRASLTAPMRN